MIVCSCSVLTEARIVETAEKLTAADPGRPITPGRLFKALDARPQCGTCFATIHTIIAEAGLAFTCPEPLASQAEREDGSGDVATIAGV